MRSPGSSRPASPQGGDGPARIGYDPGMEHIPVQIGLFGGEGQLVGCHVVTAHFRVADDGTEVFVGEHLRANRGRTERAPAGLRVTTEVEPEQLALFGPLSR